ncbi:hypothetical protein HD806DRAFT_480786 [Xylariaceae sp. AK1471]|nr:hypothetical protein HD806DRAFT_480786 [Xylariaceae sp. AK1471]
MATQQQQPPRKLDLPTLESAEIPQAHPGPQSPQLEKDAARAMSHTADWQPSLGGRRQSYRQEDRRRELMMSSVGVGGSDTTTASGGSGGVGGQGMGFSERRGG